MKKEEKKDKKSNAKDKDVKVKNKNVDKNKEKNNKKKKKEEKYKMVDSDKLRKVELVITTIVGIVFLILLFFAVTNDLFMPAALISFALFLFCICYYYIEDENKKTMVYVLFSLGVLLIVIEVIYTLVKVY